MEGNDSVLNRSLFVTCSLAIAVLAGPLATAAAAEQSPSAASATQVATAPVAPLTWTPCDGFPEAPPGAPTLPPIECATLPVPLDHGRATGRTIPFALYRVSSPGADDERLGSLFINPGGPGGTGKDFLAYLAGVLPPSIVDAYDLIAFDPRGVGASDGLECGAGVAFPYSVHGDPVAEALETGRALGAACAAEDAALLAAMGTTNVARDLDLARRALGEDRLDYLGFSYGTRIGAVYAQLFPERVGRFVLDGAVDPAQSYRTAMIDQMAGFEDALHRFFAACDTEPGCAFAGDGPGGTEARFQALYQRAASDGLPVAGGDDALDVGELIGGFVGYLYGGHAAFPVLAELFAMADSGDATQLALAAEASTAGALGQYFAVICADADTIYGRPEANFATWSLRDRAEIFTPAVLEILYCDGFPAAREPTPVLDREGLPPALVLGNTHDPATPYAAAVSLRDHWAGSSLVTYQGDGHAIAFNGSACVDEAVTDFLVDGELADDGTTCRPDRVIGVLGEVSPAGVVVALIDPSGPAAGVLEVGDVIVGLEGAAATLDALAAAVAAGDPFAVTVRRHEATLELTLRSEYPAYWRP